MKKKQSVKKITISRETLHSLDRLNGVLGGDFTPTQGLASLIILALFDRLKVKRGESFEHVHDESTNAARPTIFSTGTKPTPEPGTRLSFELSRLSPIMK